MSTELEKKALDIMNKENFRGISKENVMQFMSILDKVDPEVAKEIIAQFPEVAKMISGAGKEYSEVLTKGIDASNDSVNSCYASEDQIIEAAREQLSKDDIPFEEKKFYFDKMEDAAKRKEAKDTEHKNAIAGYLKIGGQVMIVGLVAGVSYLVGNGNLRLPSGKA